MMAWCFYDLSRLSLKTLFRFFCNVLAVCQVSRKWSPGEGTLSRRSWSLPACTHVIDRDGLSFPFVRVRLE